MIFQHQRRLSLAPCQKGQQRLRWKFGMATCRQPIFLPWLLVEAYRPYSHIIIFTAISFCFSWMSTSTQQKVPGNFLGCPDFTLQTWLYRQISDVYINKQQYVQETMISTYLTAFCTEWSSVLCACSINRIAYSALNYATFCTALCERKIGPL